MVLMAMTPDYARGYENGKQESAARVRELEADVARKDAALAAMYSATEPIAIADEHDITSEEGYVSINENTRKAIVRARALIAAALTEMPK